MYVNVGKKKISTYSVFKKHMRLWLSLTSCTWYGCAFLVQKNRKQYEMYKMSVLDTGQQPAQNCDPRKKYNK